jgi:hypothetical protein
MCGLLMCGLSLAGAAAAQPFHGVADRSDETTSAPTRNRADGWPFSLSDRDHDLRPGATHKAQTAPVIPLPRPRPNVPETTAAIRGDALNPVTTVPPTAPTPRTPALAAPGPPSASTPQPESALLGAAGQGVAGETHRPTTAETLTLAAIEPVKNHGGAAVPPVSVRDAGDGMVQIEALDASVGQVLAVLQESGLILIRLGASDRLSRTVSGTYTGTLPQVLSRLLEGYSYFLRVTASGTEVHAVDALNDTNTASRSGPADTNAASRNDNNVASRSEAGSNVEAAPAPTPAFALSAPNPVSKERARVRVQQSAKAH